MLPVIGLGAGGHARVVIETVRLAGDYEIAGLLDPKRELWGTTILRIPVLGGDELLSELWMHGIRHAFIGVGTVGYATPRRQLYAALGAAGFQLISVIHPRAIVSPSAEIGNGPTIMAGAVVNTGARLGANVTVNTGAIIEHDCVIGDHAHVAPGARLASSVTVGEGAHVGLGANVVQGIHLGRNSIVGAGAVVLADVPDGVVVVGVPARVLRRIPSG